MTAKTRRGPQRQRSTIAMIPKRPTRAPGARAARAARRQGEGWLSWEEARGVLGISKTHMSQLLAKGSAHGGLDAYRSACDGKVKLIARADVERLLQARVVERLKASVTVTPSTGE